MVPQLDGVENDASVARFHLLKFSLKFKTAIS